MALKCRELQEWPDAIGECFDVVLWNGLSVIAAFQGETSRGLHVYELEKVPGRIYCRPGYKNVPPKKLFVLPGLRGGRR